MLSSIKMQALHDVVKAGYVRYIGMSSCWAWQCGQSDFVISLCSLTIERAASSPCHAEYVPPHLTLHIHPSIHLDYAIANKLTPFISMQNHYSLIYREEEREMFPTLKVRQLLYDL